MRKAVRSTVVAVLAFVVVAMPSVAGADGRVALVVGNSTYAHIGRLPNPDNDARDMSAALRRLGFEVTTELDADRVELTEALRAFTRRSAGADVSLVFYAGHGIEMDGVNYLVPVDARLERDVDVRFETVTVDDLLVSTSGASLRLLILDACRNNPLARSMQRTAAIRSVSGGSFAGLNEDLLGDETLVAYAAAAGTTAADGRGRNSPYTTALLAYLETPVEIGLLFRRVRAQVLALTNGAQRPHEYHSLVGEHYLTRTLAAGTLATASAAPVNPAPGDPPQANPPEPDITELHVVTLRERAEAGDAAAQHEMAERYANGRGVGRDVGVAMSWYVRAAEQGHVPAQLEAGRRYAAGQGVERNDAIAASWFGKAAEQGDPRAQFDIGVMYRDGRGVAQDYAAALSWFRRLADSGDAGGQEALGDLYETGRGVEQDDAAALSWYRRAAERGSASAQNRLGVMYSDGDGVARDDETATAWFRMAAEQGYAPAQTELGESYEGGRGVGRDYRAAVSWYRRAAEQGHAPGQVALGVMYGRGRGVEEDDAEALRWYRRAAEQGDARGQNLLGGRYSLGFGVGRDHAEAVRWYRRAAEQGLAVAQTNLGWKYENGEGVRRDHAEAVRWYRRAADQGFAGGQNGLGRMYENGRGVQRDRAEAVRLYRLAAEQGDWLAQENLDRLRRQKSAGGPSGEWEMATVIATELRDTAAMRHGGTRWRDASPPDVLAVGPIRTVIDIRLSTSSMPRGTRGLPHGAYSGPVDPGALLPGTHRAENEPPTQGVNQLVSSSVLSALLLTCNVFRGSCGCEVLGWWLWPEGH